MSWHRAHEEKRGNIKDMYNPRSRSRPSLSSFAPRATDVAGELQTTPMSSTSQPARSQPRAPVGISRSRFTKRTSQPARSQPRAPVWKQQARISLFQRRSFRRRRRRRRSPRPLRTNRETGRWLLFSRGEVGAVICGGLVGLSAAPSWACFDATSSKYGAHRTQDRSWSS
jgi:hypothetical protein